MSSIMPSSLSCRVKIEICIWRDVDAFPSRHDPDGKTPLVRGHGTNLLIVSVSFVGILKRFTIGAPFTTPECFANWGADHAE